MKKTLLSLVALFAFGVVTAQEEPATAGYSNGDVFASGTISFSSEKTGDFKTNQFTVSPKVGYFVSDNIALGVSLSYISSTEDTYDGNFGVYEQKTTGFEAGAFGRYYFMPASRFSVFAQVYAGYATAKYEVEVYQMESKANGFGFEFAPGFNYFVSDHFAIETTFGLLGYNSIKPDNAGAESTDSFNIGLDLANINFGIVYKF
ncbi:MAG: outer membrane beta-barrel protein [Bacteroidota bacterium]